MKNYTEQAQNLIKAIDIAIDALRKHPPNNFQPEHIEHTINCYLDWRDGIINAESKYKNIRSLKYDIENVFTFFQESSGKTVDYFWQEIKKNELPYKRENRLTKILKRGKIRSQIEYDFILDVLIPYQQERIIEKSDFERIKVLLAEYEKRRE